MSDDSAYTMNSQTTLGLDYEQSQEDQEIREAYEATLTPAQLDAAALQRHRKRQRLGYSPPSSPVKEEQNDLPSLAPRSSAQHVGHILRGYYGPYGAENSQVGDGTYIEHLINSRATSDSQSQSQEPDFAEESQELEEDNDSDHELVVQLQRLRNRLSIAIQERDELQARCDHLQQEYEEADSERTKLRQELQRAAVAASTLTKILSPY
ncbi:hypothetical protein B0H16DRAFT_1683243 [Mycena metata]|uniref:Uncharacterized protein n=1 Tax=Mycena metata TaxID=1033252 RepID=A0AAD7N207_9AGAR|nr:hypothetical protein B0H16DRAFT_1563917 [Mycena metata]KAJ7778955.1 hypothetical protein B0H16DRAFT_1683243 [Mycena metata]